MSRITVVLADDHQVVRRGVRTVLEAEDDFRVIGEESDGLKVVELIEHLRPNVLLLDVQMPGLTGMEITRRILQRGLQTRVVILSMHADETFVMEALRVGARGYVLKNADAVEIVTAVREVSAGRRYLSRAISGRALEAYAEKARVGPPDVYETLTTREREVLQLAAEGSSNAEIAARLVISPRTVETHRENLMRKLGLQNQTDLIRYALRRGILPLD